MIILKNKWALSLFLGLSIFVYSWNIWANDIWIPNEAFYSEASREMIESNNFLDIYYNYEPRFNKPPMTYWLVSLSYLTFGISEFATRLPIVLLALGSLFLTFKLAEEIFKNRSISILSVFVMFFSLQFVINSRYASPEIPLTFFFLLTLYLFYKGYKSRQFKYILFSYLSLALTVLTKGYPYFIIIGFIVIVYLLVERNFKLKDFWEDIKFLKLYIGIPLTVLIGFSWYLYMYLKFGEPFLEVTLNETVKRAVAKEGSFNPFFYFIVILWGFLPYSLTFYYSLFKSKDYFKGFKFLIVWVLSLLFIFTLAKGKIPVYIIQAYAPMSIMVAYLIQNCKPKNILEKLIFYGTFIIPTVLLVIASVGLVYIFKLDYMYYLACLFPLIFLVRYKEIRILPFISALIFFFIFSISLLPKVEMFRPYDKIGKAIENNLVKKDVPLLIEGFFWHNLPFYAKRKVLRDLSLDDIKALAKKRPVLALVRRDSLTEISKFSDFVILWEGKLYRKGSESRFAVFLKYVYKATKGDFIGFEDRVLILLNN